MGGSTFLATVADMVKPGQRSSILALHVGSFLCFFLQLCELSTGAAWIILTSNKQLEPCKLNVASWCHITTSSHAYGINSRRIQCVPWSARLTARAGKEMVPLFRKSNRQTRPRQISAVSRSNDREPERRTQCGGVWNIWADPSTSRSNSLQCLSESYFE